MDEHFLKSSNQASKLLPEAGLRSIYYQGICMDNFYLLNSDSDKRKIGLVDEVGSCLRTLRRSRDLQWGIRKKVMYVPRHRDSPLHLPSSVEVVRKKERPKNRLRDEKESGNKVGKNVKQGITKREVELEKQFSCGKRKRGDTCTKGTELKRKERRETKGLETKSRTENEGSCRWSTARYEYAKKSLVEVMRKMGATWRNPVLRHDLRIETRKRIGDLGLLDHLLKHTAGMVVADGTERLVRRHNSEGAIEYWLEPADLVQIRREAGITDPYWVPPPCWKPGNIDSKCTCHGHCEKIASQLRAEINLLRSEIVELKSLKEGEKLTIEQSQVQLQLQAVDQDWQEKYESLLMQHRKLQKHLTAISTSFLAMKEEICSLKEEKEKRRPDELAMVVKELSQANWASEMQFVQEKENRKQVMAGNEVGTEKIMARKNGFRIYKPPGTFLQPSMVSDSSYSPQFTSSATSVPPQLLLLPSPTSSLSPQCASFFYQPLQNSQCKNQTQAQSQAALAQSQALCPAPQPSAGYLSPGMKNYGASQMECDELISAMVPPTDTNSKGDF